MFEFKFGVSHKSFLNKKQINSLEYGSLWNTTLLLVTPHG